MLAATSELVGTMAGVADVGEFTYYSPTTWALPLTLLAPPGGRVPRRSRWYLVTDRRDGSGTLELFPAADGGLPRTNHHQGWNGPVHGRPWCSGAMCPRAFRAGLARYFENTEPPAFPARGPWLLDGALRWLDAASAGTLVRAGEPFELPVVSSPDAATVAYSESGEQLSYWQDRIGTAGLLQFGEVRRDALSVVFTYFDAQGRGELGLRWGDALPKLGGRRKLGAWIALPALPILAPWHVPRSWGELIPVLDDLCGPRGVLSLLRGLKGLHDGEQHLLLLGAPIPVVVGGPPAAFHWLAAWMPPLASITPPTHGFRPTTKSRAIYNT